MFDEYFGKSSLEAVGNPYPDFLKFCMAKMEMLPKKLPSVKLTCPLKINGWKMYFLLK